MAIHPKRSKGKVSHITDDEAVAHYDYLLDLLPATIIRSGHAAVFDDMPPQQRQQLNDAMSPTLDTTDLRAAIDREGALRQVARAFVMTDAVRAYFSTGAGSVSIDTQPPWVGDLVNYESAPVDAGTMHHRKGVNSGVWFA